MYVILDKPVNNGENPTAHSLEEKEKRVHILILRTSRV